MEKLLNLEQDEIIQSFSNGKLTLMIPILKDAGKAGCVSEEETVISFAGRKEMRFLISVRLKDHEGSVSKGVVVFRPLADVHRLVNRISGAVARFRFKDILTCNLIWKNPFRLRKWQVRA
jgi:hypothetical protein